MFISSWEMLFCLALDSFSYFGLWNPRILFSTSLDMLLCWNCISVNLLLNSEETEKLVTLLDILAICFPIVPCCSKLAPFKPLVMKPAPWGTMIIVHSWFVRRWSRSKPYKSQKTPAPVESHLAGCGVREALCSDATRSQLTDAEQAACTTSGGSCGWCCWNFLVDSLRSAA